MKKLSYNIFSELKSNIDDFENEGIYIVGKPSVRDSYDKKGRGMYGGYYFSQKDTLEAIDLAKNSKFKRGQLDSEGKRKTYMNIVNFFSDVAVMKITVKSSQYILEPTKYEYTWPVYFEDKAFKEWSEENSYDDIISSLAEDYVSRGTCVTKRVNKNVERVPIRSIKCSQGAISLKHAALNGGYVIIEEEKSYNELKKYPNWNLDGLDKKKNYCYLERYSLVPLSVVKYFNKEDWTDADENEMVLAYQVLLPDETKAKLKPQDQAGNVLYIQEIEPDDFPLEEAHYSKMDGRWLGVGEVEKQLEAQIARNFTANLRRRSLLWATKKLFKSSDDEIAKNFLIESKDGDVIKIRKDSDLAQVNVSSQHLGDFAADDDVWHENSKQNAFAFEVSTGESLPAGTPFRLGVILEKAVSGYFKNKQDHFSNYLKRSFFSQLIPLFKKEVGECTLRYLISDENSDSLKQAMIIIHSNDRVFDSYMNKKPRDYQEVAQEVEQEMIRSPYLFADIPEKFFSEPQEYMRLNITDDIGPDIETLTTIYTILSQKGDPRADKVLSMLLAKKGKNYAAIVGPAAPAQPAQQDQKQPATPAVDKLKELATSTAQ